MKKEKIHIKKSEKRQNMEFFSENKGNKASLIMVAFS
jgi:hypothetical protein